jgi:hypothetical protein
VHHGEPHVGVVTVGLGRHAEDLLDLRAHVRRRGSVVGVDHGGDPLDEAPVPGLRLGESHRGVPTGDQLTGIADRQHRRVPVQPADADLDGQGRTVRPRQHRLERSVGARVIDPARDELGDREAGGIAADQMGAVLVRQHDLVPAHDEQGLGGGREQPVPSESRLERARFVPQHVSRRHRTEQAPT